MSSTIGLYKAYCEIEIGQDAKEMKHKLCEVRA